MTENETIKVSRFVSGETMVSAEVIGGKASISLHNLRVAPPSGVYSFTEEEEQEMRHIFTLRCAKTAHPQMYDLMRPLLKEVQEKMPIIFDDILYQ